MRRHVSGFSLYELLITLAVFATVLTLGLPSLGNIVARNKVRTQVDNLFHAIHLARKESIVRRRVVTLCPSADRQNCDESLDWSNGWIMFVNHSRSTSTTRDAGEPILRQSGGLSGVRISANRRSFALRSTELRATNGTIVFCDLHDRITPRALVVSYTGRPRVTLKNSRGKSYQCAH